MAKSRLVTLLALAAFTVSAGSAEFKSAGLPRPVAVDWRLDELTSGTGNEEVYRTVTPKQLDLEWREKTSVRPDALDVVIDLKNTGDKVRLIRVAATAAVPFRDFQWWNGYLNTNTVKFDPGDKLLSVWFPANAAISGGTALILGLDPMQMCSRVVSEREDAAGGTKLLVALPVYLEPGKRFQAKFTVAATKAKFGYHDVIQRWYDLFPAAYRPADGISPDVISGESSYMYWKPENFPLHFHSDLLRRYYGGQGSWEWCYKPFIRAGDWGISDKYSIGFRGHTAESVAKYRDNVRRRLAPAEFQNVAPMWYLNVSWTEWSIWKDHFPGIEYAKENQKRKCWGQDVIYGIYPGGSAYTELFIQSLKSIPKDFSASRGIGWDSCFAHREIGPENVGFKGTEPKSFERGKPFVIEAAGISELLDCSRRQFAGKFRMANAVNLKLVSPFMIGVRADAALYEGHPMVDPKRLLRLESMRARLGSPKAVAWHKHALPEQMRWIDWDDLTPAEAQDASRQAMDNILFLCYYWGGIAAPGMPGLGVKRIADTAPELVSLIKQGWQPSPAVETPDDILAARYGQGAGARVVFINPGYRSVTFKAFFPAAYWEGKAALVAAAPAVTSTLNPAGATVEVTLEPRSILVTRVAGLVDAAHTIMATGEIVAESGKEPFHRFLLKTPRFFRSEAEFFRADPSAPVRISCEDDMVRFKAGEAVKYAFDTAKWPPDVQSANLRTATLSLVEYPLVATAELDVESLAALKLPEAAKANRLFIIAPEGAPANEAQRIAEWVRFCTQDRDSYAEPVINGTPGNDAVVIKLESAPDELKNHQRGRAFLEDKVVRLVFRTPEDAKSLTLAALNRFDAAYPRYAKLPEKSKGLQKIGLAGKTLMPAPAKKPLRPTLLEMMKRNKIR